MLIPQQQQNRKYGVVNAPTYAGGLHRVREASLADRNSLQPTYPINGQELPRPFSCKEILEARLNDYETTHDPTGTLRTEENRRKLFRVGSDSCTLVAYQGGTSKFKIVPISRQLLELPRDFDQLFLPLSFNDIDAEELDRGNGTYNCFLTKPQVLNNAGWQYAVKEDHALLGTYFDLVSRLNERNAVMGFDLIYTPQEDQGRALFVHDLYSGSDAGGNDNLFNNGSFLRVAQSVAPAGRAPEMLSSAKSMDVKSQQVLAICSRFDKYIPPGVQDDFEAEKQGVVRDLSALLKNG